MDQSENLNAKSDQTSCCICLSDVDDISQATMEFCSHIFHIDCILSWGKRVNKCPLCKVEFHRIIFQGKKVEVEGDEVDDEAGESEDEDEMEFGSDEDNDTIYCEICEEECEIGGERFTFCHGNCGRYIHLSCRGLVDEENWYCYDCQPARRRRVPRPLAPSRRTGNPERTQSVFSSLHSAEESISRQLQLMRQRMEREAYEPPLIVPNSSENAIRLRSKSKLATEIGREMMADSSKPSPDAAPETTYKRIRRNTTRQSSVATFASHPTPTSSQQTLLITNQLSQNAQNSRKLESSSVNDLLTRLTAPSSEASTFQRSPPALPFNTTSPITSSSSHYTSTTSRVPVLHNSNLKRQLPSSYSTSCPVDHSFTMQSSNADTTTITRDLVEQYIVKLQAPFRINNLEQRGEMLSDLVPKIFSLCVLHNNQEFLSGLLDYGILSVLAQYLTGQQENVIKVDSASTSALRPKRKISDCPCDLQPSGLSTTRQAMILRTIHCLPIKARHLFHLRGLPQNSTESKVKIGKFIPLIRILGNYVQHKGQGQGDDSKGGEEALRNLGIRILTDWKTILKHYPSAIAKIESMLGEV
jgi:hypothetical protein